MLTYYCKYIYFTVIEGNIVAGVDRIAYVLDGESCTTHEEFNNDGWKNNEARSAMHGIIVWRDMCLKKEK